MAQSKIVKYGLEQLVLDARKDQRTLAEMTRRANAQLAKRKVKDRLSEKVVERWLTSIDKASLAVAHKPEVVEEAVAGALDVMANLRLLDGTLKVWLDEAARAVTPMRGVLWDPMAQEPADREDAREASEQMRKEIQRAFDDYGVDDAIPKNTVEALNTATAPVQVLVTDWQARLGTAKELRQHAEAVANILERVYNATQLEAFQAAMTEAIAEADPETAKRLVRKLQDKQSVIRAQLLGSPV